MAPPSAMRPSAPFLGAGASSAGGPSSVSASASAVPTGGSRIPVPPPRSIKREASESLTSVQARESPSLQRLHRLASLDSPAKFRKPTLLEDQQDGGSPALAASHAVRSLSLAPNCRSPLATPPGRRKSGIGGAGSVNVNRSSLKPTRLSMYGVPLSMVLGGSEVASRRGPNLLGGGSAGMIANGNAGFLSSPSLRDKRIVVCVRKRPLSSAEVRGGDDCVSVNDHDATVSISVLRTKLDGLNKYHEEYAFAFDRAYGELASNEQVYEEVVDPLVRFCVQGGRATCFAYGQTGSGKTHTMFHPRDGTP